MSGSFFSNYLDYLPEKRYIIVLVAIGGCGVLGLLITAGLIWRTAGGTGNSGLVIESPAPDVNCCLIQVSGAVRKPGIYQLPPGSRVYDALVAADSFAETADPEVVASLDLVAPLTDGQKIHIPSLVSSTTAQPPQSTAGVSLNEATRAELIDLPYIGEKKADAIVQGRPYQSIDQFFEKNSFSERQKVELMDLVKL